MCSHGNIGRLCCYLVTKLCPTLWLHGLQHTRLLCTSPSPGACSNSCPLSCWCHATISSSVTPFSSFLQSFPGQGLSQWVSSSHQLAKVLEIQHQSLHWIFRVDFLQDWLIWSPCSPKNSQESHPAPQFKSINSLTLSFLYGLTLTSVHEWKKHSVDYMDICWQKYVSVFKFAVYICHSFSSREQVS